MGEILESVQETAEKIRKLEVRGARNIAIAAIKAIETLASQTKLEAALQLAEKLQPFGVGRKWEEQMLIDRIPMKVVHHKVFSIER